MDMTVIILLTKIECWLGRVRMHHILSDDIGTSMYFDWFPEENLSREPESNQWPMDVIEKTLQSTALPTELSRVAKRCKQCKPQIHYVPDFPLIMYHIMIKLVEIKKTYYEMITSSSIILEKPI